MMMRVAQIDCLLHGVGHHQRGQAIALDHFAGQGNNLVRTFGIERSGVFVEKKKGGLDPRSHQQGQCLALAAGE